MGGPTAAKDSQSPETDADRIGHPNLSKRTDSTAAGPGTTASLATANRPPVTTAGNMAMQRRAAAHATDDVGWGVTLPTASDNAPPVVTIEFDDEYPWLFSVAAPADEAAITAELYGEVPVPLTTTEVTKWAGIIPKDVTRYVAYPQMLTPHYLEIHQRAMQKRKNELMKELDEDVARCKDLVVTDLLEMLQNEEQVLRIMRRWAQEPFPSKITWLDELFIKMNGVIFDVGIISTQYTNLYSYILNHFARVDEVRELRDQYAPIHAHEEAIEEMSFGGYLWEDLKSGRMASRIGNYFVGLGEAAVGLLEGIKTLLTDPGKVLDAIGHLPQTLSTLWENRGKLWDKFANASPDEQARMIGRFTGETEILIGTAGAGGAGTATKAPQLATAFEIVNNARGAAALATRGGALTADLGVLGTEGARSTAILAIAAQGATGTQTTADQLAQEQKGAAGEAKTGEPTVKEPAANDPVANDPAVKEAAKQEPPLPELSKDDFYKLSYQERDAYLTKWMKQEGITRLVDVNDHHAWPKYLGGPEDGPLIPLDEQLHRAFHAELDKYLPRNPQVPAGSPTGGAYYASLSDAQKAKNIATLKFVAGDFDRTFKTRILATLEKALQGTPYQ